MKRCVRAFAIGFVLTVLPACAQDRPPSLTEIQPTASPLNGNWIVLGAFNDKGPDLSMVIGLEGTHLHASGKFGFSCSNDEHQLPNSGVGGSFNLTGELAADGSFTLSDAPQHPLTNSDTSPGMLTITGTVSVGEQRWTGSYHWTHLKPPCVFDTSGELDVRRLPAMQGTYVGTALVSPDGRRSVNVTLTMDQASTIKERSSPIGTQLFIPLSASIEIKGGSCLLHGNSKPLTISTLIGNSAGLVFKMDDGSVLTVSALLMDISGSTISFSTYKVQGGPCDGQSFFQSILTQQ